MSGHSRDITIQFRFGDRDKERKGGVVGCVGGGERVPLITRLQDRELQEMRDEGQSCDCHVINHVTIMCRKVS